MTPLGYNYFRYYDPRLGRYITPDPIGQAGGNNIYGYAFQNPLKYTDPDGLNPAWAARGGWAVDAAWDALHNDANDDATDNTGEGVGDALESRAHQDPITARPFNPGRDCEGNCNPCPPNQMWPTGGGGHGHPNGVWHTLIWNQNPETCMCYPDRPSQGLMGW